MKILLLCFNPFSIFKHPFSNKTWIEKSVLRSSWKRMRKFVHSIIHNKLFTIELTFPKCQYDLLYYKKMLCTKLCCKLKLVFMFLVFNFDMILVDIAIRMSVASPISQFRQSRLFPALVWFVIEIVEQHIEENGIWKGEAYRPTWIATVRVQELGWVQESHSELDLRGSKGRKY